MTVTSLFLLASCKSSVQELVLYTSDIEDVRQGEAIDIPITVTFRMLGEDEKGYLEKASAVARSYLSPKSEMQQSKGQFGDVLVIKTRIPMIPEGDADQTLRGDNRLLFVEVSDDQIALRARKGVIGELNKKLSEINWVLSFEPISGQTRVRVVNDSRGGFFTMMATAVWVLKKPELHVLKELDRREEVEIVFKGGDESVYSQIDPQFTLMFGMLSGN